MTKAFYSLSLQKFHNWQFFPSTFDVFTSNMISSERQKQPMLTCLTDIAYVKLDTNVYTECTKHNPLQSHMHKYASNLRNISVCNCIEEHNLHHPKCAIKIIWRQLMSNWRKVKWNNLLTLLMWSFCEFHVEVVIPMWVYASTSLVFSSSKITEIICCVFF